MSEPADGTVHSAGAGSVAGTHPERTPLRVLAGSSTTDQANTIQSAIFPIACFKLEDVNFDFDSSVLTADVANEMPVLKELIDQHTEPGKAPGDKVRRPVASIFGHTDPEGDDDYNKTLGGRRAAVFYGLLTRRPEIWEDMYSDTKIYTSVNVGGKWGLRSIQIMLNALPADPAVQPPADPLVVDGQTGPKTQDAVKRFQSSHGLGASGQADAATRKALFLAYMDVLCVDGAGKPWQLDPKDDFLGHNADTGGKGDFQGCGEFNPIMLFSKSDLDAFTAASDHTERDAKNRQNRRVMTLLYRPGAKITPKFWPCPQAIKDTTACRDRFWSDGNKRRDNGPEERKFEKTHDTFACRFYHRMVSNSPCESDCNVLILRLVNAFHEPMALVKYQLVVGSKTSNGVTDKDGALRAEVPAGVTGGTLTLLEMSDPDPLGQPTSNQWVLSIFFKDIGAISTDGGAAVRLDNLGLVATDLVPGMLSSPPADGASDPVALARFQSAAQLDENDGTMDDKTKTTLRKVYGS